VVPRIGDECFTHRFATGEVGPLWDRGHLVWRYERHPYFAYRFVHVTGDGKDVGLAVVRDTASGTVLADMYARPDDFAAVLAAVAGVVRSPIVGPFVGAPLAERFRRAGWMSVASGNRLLGRSNDPALHRVLTARHWCFFGGDSDSDR
jgi:hypothetical protein